MQSSYYFPKGSLNTPRENNIPSNLFKKKKQSFFENICYVCAADGALFSFPLS